MTGVRRFQEELVNQKCCLQSKLNLWLQVGQTLLMRQVHSCSDSCIIIMIFIRIFDSFYLLLLILVAYSLLCYHYNISAIAALNVCLLVGQGNPGQGPDQDYGVPLWGWHAENQEWIQEEIWKISLLFHPGKFFIFGFISWAFAAVFIGFVVPLEFMGGVLEATERILYYLCTVRKLTFIFRVYSWYSSCQPLDSVCGLCAINWFVLKENSAHQSLSSDQKKRQSQTIVLWLLNENRTCKLILPFISVLKEKAP